MSTTPASLLGLPGGSLATGEPADLILLDPDEPWVLDRDDLRSKCKNSPFDEARMTGRVLATYVEGRESDDERFIDYVRRVGLGPFKERVYG